MPKYSYGASYQQVHSRGMQVLITHAVLGVNSSHFLSNGTTQYHMKEYESSHKEQVKTFYSLYVDDI